MPITKKTEEKVKKIQAAPDVVKASRPKKADVMNKTASEEKKQSKLTAEVFDLTGKVAGKISLPEEIFGVKINKILIAQAVRVYLANQRMGTASTKTRGEVEGSSRKIYRQKGTGRARHGSIRAPIFVHGGVVFGPRPRDYSLQLPQKMKRAALFSALTTKFNDGEMKILEGLEKIEPKTKMFLAVIDKLGINDKKKKILLITSSEIENLKRAAGNIEGVTITAAKRLNTYEILNNRQLVFMKDAIDELKNHFLHRESKKI
jgi:large subunit ribosomal protein L4